MELTWTHIIPQDSASYIESRRSTPYTWEISATSLATDGEFRTCRTQEGSVKYEPWKCEKRVSAKIGVGRSIWCFQSNALIFTVIHWHSSDKYSPSPKALILLVLKCDKSAQRRIANLWLSTLCLSDLDNHTKFSVGHFASSLSLTDVHSLSVDAEMCKSAVTLKLELIKQFGVVLQGTIKPSQSLHDFCTKH
jgi:hypothetical protein